MKNGCIRGTPDTTVLLLLRKWLDFQAAVCYDFINEQTFVTHGR